MINKSRHNEKVSMLANIKLFSFFFFFSLAVYAIISYCIQSNATPVLEIAKLC